MQGRWIDAIGPGGSKGGVSMRSTLECIFVVEGCCSRRTSTGFTPSPFDPGHGGKQDSACGQPARLAPAPRLGRGFGKRVK